MGKKYQIGDKNYSYRQINYTPIINFMNVIFCMFAHFIHEHNDNVYKFDRKNKQI